MEKLGLLLRRRKMSVNSRKRRISRSIWDLQTIISGSLPLGGCVAGGQFGDDGLMIDGKARILFFGLRCDPKAPKHNKWLHKHTNQKNIIPEGLMRNLFERVNALSWYLCHLDPLPLGGWAINGFSQQLVQLERVVGRGGHLACLPTADAGLWDAGALRDFRLRHGHGPELSDDGECVIHAPIVFELELNSIPFRIMHQCILTA